MKCFTNSRSRPLIRGSRTGTFEFVVIRDALVPVLRVGEPAGLLPAREQMAMTLGWHIILACFGVAFPAMILVMHWRGIRRQDQVALGLAQRWSKVAAVLFAIGAVSGTVLSFEMGLLWPGLMGRFGDVLGLPFAFEGLAFFVEAIFLGIYLYGWGRIPSRRHMLMLVPMAVSGVVGTFSVIAVNAWMNNPTGFRMVDGEVTDVQPWRAFFNDGVWGQFAHMWVGAFMVVGFLVSGVYAVGMLRGRRRRSPPAGVHRPVRLRECGGVGAAVHRPSAWAAARSEPTLEAGGVRACDHYREPVSSAAGRHPCRRAGPGVD